jgi:hypothetical protein
VKHETSLTFLLDPGGGGCIWEVGQTPKQAKCVTTNVAQPDKYAGWAQPPTSPDYIDEAHSNGSLKGFGGTIKFLFDPTAPRWEQRAKAGKVAKTLMA